MKTVVHIRVNEDEHEVEIDTRMILADLLREKLGLTGLHLGCTTGNCGACTVILDGVNVKSCCVLAADAEGCDVLTLEGLASATGELHAIQQAFESNQGLQCGFCTSGMILSTLALLSENPKPTEDEIRHGIAGNLCRCTGYHFIVTSIQDAADRLTGDTSPAGAVDP